VCCAQYDCFFLCSSLISCFSVMLLRYFLNYFEMVPLAPIVTALTCFTFHMRCISVVLLLLFGLWPPCCQLFCLFSIRVVLFLLTGHYKLLSHNLNTQRNILNYCYWSACYTFYFPDHSRSHCSSLHREFLHQFIHQ
jgi:hypothetical protein